MLVVQASAKVSPKATARSASRVHPPPLGLHLVERERCCLSHELLQSIKSLAPTNRYYCNRSIVHPSNIGRIAGDHLTNHPCGDWRERQTEMPVAEGEDHIASAA